MERVITATEANRDFSRLLGEVAGGEVFVITSRGKAVARTAPSQSPDRVSEAVVTARRAHLNQLASRPVTDVGPWTRAELYDR